MGIHNLTYYPVRERFWLRRMQTVLARTGVSYAARRTGRGRVKDFFSTNQYEFETFPKWPDSWCLPRLDIILHHVLTVWYLDGTTSARLYFVLSINRATPISLSQAQHFDTRISFVHGKYRKIRAVVAEIDFVGSC